MVGTGSNRCLFSGCFYQIDGAPGWYDVYFPDWTLHTDDTGEWGVNSPDTNRVEIWDKNPIP